MDRKDFLKNVLMGSAVIVLPFPKFLANNPKKNNEGQNGQTPDEEIKLANICLPITIYFHQISPNILKTLFQPKEMLKGGNYRLYDQPVVLSFFISIFAKKITGSITELLCAKFYKSFLCKI